MDRNTSNGRPGEIREASDARPGHDDSPRRDTGMTETPREPAGPGGAGTGSGGTPEPGTTRATPGRTDLPETGPNPAPGIRHEPEPDGGNIMPAEDEPGTL